MAKFQWPFKKRGESLSQEIIQKREELLVKARLLRGLINEPESGWKDFYDLINEYLEALKYKKDSIRMDIASDESINELKMLDRERLVLMWVLQVPKQFSDAIEKSINEELLEESEAFLN